MENISKRCGGFLRKLSLRGCQGVGDNALRYSHGTGGALQPMGVLLGGSTAGVHSAVSDIKH